MAVPSTLSSYLLFFDYGGEKPKGIYYFHGIKVMAVWPAA